jgi:regulatory protein
MVTKPRSYERKEKRPSKPLDPRRLNDLALHYVARFATSAAKLEDYLRRKLRERGWDGEVEPDLSELTGKFVAAGYIDDEAYARAKSGALLRRGFGNRRIGQALSAAGIAEDIRVEVRAGVAAERSAALALATKRRFGPFGAAELDRPARDKQIAAMLRAGHSFDTARALIGAADVAAAQQWAEAGNEADQG